MPRSPRKPRTAPKIRFDYARLRQYINAAGGLSPVARRAGTSPQAFRQIQQRNPLLPLPDVLCQLFAELKLPLAVIRTLFIEDKP